MRFFVSTDFGLLPTLTACVEQNGRTPKSQRQLLPLKLPDGETTVYAAHNLYLVICFYLQFST